MRQLPSQKTPVTVPEMAAALAGAWGNYFGESAPVESLKVLLAQWALETGWGKSMRCYNIGNVKHGVLQAKEGLDYQYFSCNEILSSAYVTKQGFRSDSRVRITSEKKGSCVVWFDPDHPGCKFVAFEDLAKGAAFYLKLLVQRFAPAWPAVLAGNPQEFARALKQARYYTADETAYAKALTSITQSLEVATPELTRQEKETFRRASTAAFLALLRRTSKAYDD